MKISRKDNDALNALLTIDIDRKDFLEKVDVVLVSKTGGDDFPRLPVGVGFTDPAAGSFDAFHEAAPVNAWLEGILTPDFGDAGFLIFWESGLVSAGDVEGFSVG